MTVTGTVSDFERAGGFGLILADDGDLFPFNVLGAPAEMRDRFKIGTRVRFRMRQAEPAPRAVEVTPLDATHQDGDLGGSSVSP